MNREIKIMLAFTCLLKLLHVRDNMLKVFLLLIRLRKKRQHALYQTGLLKCRRFAITRKPCHRRMWVRPGQSGAVWDAFVSNNVVSEEWSENFHMSRASFMLQSDLIKPYVERVIL